MTARDELAQLPRTVGWARCLPADGHQCGVMLYRQRDDYHCRTIFQHGDNPEHVLIVTDLDMIRSDTDNYLDYVNPWLRSVHEHEATARSATRIAKRDLDVPMEMWGDDRL